MWARTYLSKAGLVENTRRGFVKITDRGVDMLKSKINEKTISLKDLSQFDEYIVFKNSGKNKNIDNSEGDESADTPQDKIDFGFSEINDALRDELLKKLKNTDPYYFEKIILLLFQKMGYGDFEETPRSGDGGIDGVINQDKLGIEKIYTQAKRYTSTTVGEKDIRNFIGAMSGDVSKGIFVTTSSFDSSAITKAKDDHNHKIILIDGERLVKLMIENDVGVQTKSEYRIKEIDEDFFVE